MGSPPEHRGGRRAGVGALPKRAGGRGPGVRRPRAASGDEERPVPLPSSTDREGAGSNGGRAARPSPGAGHQPALLDPVGRRGGEGAAFPGGRQVKRAAAVLAVTIAGFVGLGVVGAPVAQAHPLGNFTVNRYSGLALSPGRIQVTYVVDMAEIPTFQEMPSIDTNGDGTASAAERQS